MGINYESHDSKTIETLGNFASINMNIYHIYDMKNEYVLPL